MAEAAGDAAPSRAAIAALVAGEAPAAVLARHRIAADSPTGAKLVELAASDALLARDARIARAAARARRPLHRAGAGRRPAAHAGDPADRPQPARLRSVPDPERVRRRGRRAAGGAAARAPRGGRQAVPRVDRDRAVGHRQPEDRGRPDRAGAGADGRRAALRQLRPPRRRDADSARRTRPAARRRRDDAVRHLPRPAAAADQAAGRGRVPRGVRRRARRAELRPQARARLPGRARLRPRDRRAARVRQCRRRLRLQRQPPDREQRLGRRGRTRRDLHAAQGLRLRRGGQARRAAASCCKACSRGVELAYQNLDSVELGVTTVDHYFDTLGGISRAVRRARNGDDAAVYIGDQTRGDGTVRTLAEQVALETRTRMLNPKWYEGMLAARLRGRAADRGAHHATRWAGRPPRARSRRGSTSS